MKNNNHMLISSDFHLKENQMKIDKNGEYYLDSLVQLEKKVDEIKPEYLVNLGDTFHNKDKVSMALLIIYYKFIKRVSKKCKVIQIIGNHDFSFISENGYYYHSLKLFQNLDNVITVEKWHRFNEDIIFMNYCRTQDRFNEYLKEAGPAKVLMTHLDMNGFKLGDDYIEKHVFLNPENIQTLGFKYFFSGHYHEPQTKIINDVHYNYIGSFFTTNFSESDQEKRMILFNYKDLTYESIPTGMTFHKSFFIDVNEPLPEIPKEELDNGVKFRVVITGTKEQIKLKKIPKNYPAKIQNDYINSKQERIVIKKNDSKEDILEKYTDMILKEKYKNNETKEFNREKLLNIGVKYLSKVKDNL